MTLYDICRAECIRQYDDSPAKIEGLMRAVEWAKPCETLQEGDIRVIAALINALPDGRIMEYRKTPAVFNQGNPAIKAELVPGTMDILICAIRNRKRLGFTTDELVKEFLDIHPFSDGNGRVAFVLYNWLNGTLDNPVTLPYYYGES